MPREKYKGAYYHHLPFPAKEKLKKKKKTKIQLFVEELEKYSTYKEAKKHIKEIAKKLKVHYSMGYRALKRAQLVKLEEE